MKITCGSDDKDDSFLMLDPETYKEKQKLEAMYKEISENLGKEYFETTARLENSCLIIPIHEIDPYEGVDEDGNPV